VDASEGAEAVPDGVVLRDVLAGFGFRAGRFLRVRDVDVSALCFGHELLLRELNGPPGSFFEVETRSDSALLLPSEFWFVIGFERLWAVLLGIIFLICL
jgi:hypothetical protein